MRRFLSVALASLLVSSVALSVVGIVPVKASAEESTCDAVLNIDANTKRLDESYDISEYLYGLFLEDINYSVDGGLYAEMVINRSFEYDEYATNGHYFGWSQVGDVEYNAINGETDGSYLNEHNPTYLRINAAEVNDWAGVKNSGYDYSTQGMYIEEGAKYDFSVYLRGEAGTAVKVKLSDGETVYAEGEITLVDHEGWAKYELELTSSATCNSALALELLTKNAVLDADMVSLFPQDTYKDRKYGLREDLVQLLEDLTPTFLRFPGGCVVEGKSLDTAYSWKDSIGDGLAMQVYNATTGATENTVGDVASRPIGVDIWSDITKATATPYYMTYGVGFYEYFVLCEDLNALPVPILNCGLSCQAQSPTIQRAIPGTAKFDQYVQDALDLVEFCRGDETTTWGAVRIAMGHSEPFELKYIGIGNEQWSSEYYENYLEFVKVFNEKREENPEMYGDIELILANGPDNNDTYGWDMVDTYSERVENYAGLVDEHYYESNEWLLANTNRYDADYQNMTMGSQGFKTRDYYSYDHDGVKVFIGEYASNTKNIWYGALCEAAFMTGIERNGDIIEMAAYAPLFGSERLQWNPDLIYFGNNYNYVSCNYYVQKLFMNNACSQRLKTEYITDTDRLYQVTGVTKDGDIVIKIVNVNASAMYLGISIDNLLDGYNTTATVTTIYNTDKNAKNTASNPDAVKPTTSTMEVGSYFEFGARGYSVSVIRIENAAKVTEKAGCGTVNNEAMLTVGVGLLLVAGVIFMRGNRKARFAV